MPPSIEQQKQIGIVFREVADLRGEVKELRVAMIGIDGKNGIRGDMQDFMQYVKEEIVNKLKDMETIMEEHINEDHAKACYYLQDKEVRAKESIELKKVRMTVIAMGVVALISAASAIVVALITVGA